MKNFKDVWEDAAANSVSGGGVSLPADAVKPKRKKSVYDGRTKEGRKFVERMVARKKAKQAAEDKKLYAQNMKSVQVKEGKMDGAKLTGQEISVYFRKNPIRDKAIKKAVEFALDHGGAMNFAIKGIEKMKRGMSKHPEVKKALQYANENVQEQVSEKVTLKGQDIFGLKDSKGKPHTAKAVLMGGKLGYRVTNQFGDFETLNLKAFAKKFG